MERLVVRSKSGTPSVDLGTSFGFFCRDSTQPKIGSSVDCIIVRYGNQTSANGMPKTLFVEAARRTDFLVEVPLPQTISRNLITTYCPDLGQIICDRTGVVPYIDAFSSRANKAPDCPRPVIPIWVRDCGTFFRAVGVDQAVHVRSYFSLNHKEVSAHINLVNALKQSYFDWLNATNAQQTKISLAEYRSHLFEEQDGRYTARKNNENILCD